jgi:hypothetical protein
LKRASPPESGPRRLRYARRPNGRYVAGLWSTSRGSAPGLLKRALGR